MKFLIFIFLSIYCLHSEDAWVPHEFGAKSKFVNYGEVIPIYSEGTLVTYNKNNYIKFDTSQILKQENSMNFEFAHFKNNMTEFIKISHEVSKDNNKTYINTLLEKYKNGVKTNYSKTLVKSFDMKEFSLIDFNCYTRVLDDSLCAIVSTYTYYLAQLKITESSTIFYNVLDNNYYVVAGKLSSYNRKSKIAIVITNYISENLADKIITQNNRLKKVKYGYEDTLLYILSSLKVKHYETNVGETGNVILLKNVTDKRNEIFKYEYPKNKRIYTFKDDYLDCLISSNDNAIFILDSNGNLRSKMISSPEEDFLFELQPLNIRKLLFVMNDYLYCLDDQNYIHKINLTEKASRCEFYSDSIAIIGLPYKLNNLSIGDISSHRWYIDYDYRVLDMSPNILFYETGEKVIKLKCYYNNGSRSKIYLDTVRVYEIKDLEFDYKVIDKEKRIVEFETSKITDEFEYKLIWNFGDGEYSYELKPTHSFKEGINKVSVSAIFGNKYITKSKTVLIDLYENNYSNFLIGNIDEKQLPTNNDLPFVYFCGNTNGIIVSDFGEVFKTTNGGENWEKIIDFKEKIKIVKKTDDCKLFYVTESDRIFFTEGLNENIIEVKSHNINSKINDISYHENKLVILLDYNNIIRYDLTTKSFELNTFVLTFNFNQHQNIIDSPALTMDNYSEYNKFTKFLIGGISQNFESVIPNIKLLSLGVHSEHYNLFSPISISDGSLITENDSVTQIKFIDENQFVFVENGKELKYYNFNYSYSLSTKAIAEEGLGKIYRDNYLFAIPTNKGQILYKGLNDNNNDENLNSLQVANISNNPLFCYAQLDNQYAIVTSTEGKFYLLGNTTTNLKEYEQYSANVYPNPTNNEVTIFVDSEISNAQIKLFDSNAKIIITDFELVDNNHIKLNTNDLANGIYYVQIQNKNSSLTLPITVSK